MKILVLSFFLLSTVFYTEAAVQRGISDEGPRGVCLIRSLNLSIPNGQSVIRDCVEYICNYPEYIIYTCGVAMIQGPNGIPCVAAMDLSKPYPACCISNKCQ